MKLVLCDNRPIGLGYDYKPLQSTSARGTKSKDPSDVSNDPSSDSLLTVQLPKDEYVRYVARYFATRGKSLGITTTQSSYYDLVVYLGQVSSFIGSLRASLRNLARDILNADPELTDDRLSIVSPLTFRNFVIQNSDGNMNADMVRDYLLGLTGKHVIKKTPTGFEIMFSGLPGSQSSSGSCLESPRALSAVPFPENKTGYPYEDYVSSGRIGRNHLKMIVAVSQALNSELSGSVSEPLTSMTRKVTILPLNYDFVALLSKLNVVASKFVPNLDLFGSLEAPKIEGTLYQALQENVSMLVVQEAFKSSVDASYASTTPVTAESLKISAEAAALNVRTAISFSLGVPQKLAEFITQTPVGKQVPMVPLSSWVVGWTISMMRKPKSKGEKGTRLSPNKAPKYVLSASGLPAIVEQRNKLGFFSEPGRTNEDSILTSNTGRLHWCPPAKEVATENAKNYEALLEEALVTSFDAGTPLMSNQQGENNKVFSVASPKYREHIKDLKTKVGAFKGSLQTYNWDYNVVLTSSMGDPERLQSYDLSGSVRPDDLSVGDYLRRKFSDSMSVLFSDSAGLDSSGRRAERAGPETFGALGDPTPMLQTTLFRGIRDLYSYLLYVKQAPDLQELVLEASKDLGLISLEMSDAAYDYGLYFGVMDNQFSVKPEFTKIDTVQNLNLQTTALFKILGAVMRDAYGGPGSNLARVAMREGHDFKDDPHYFNSQFYTLGEFKNVYNYLGGLIFQKLCAALMKAPIKTVSIIDPTHPLPLPDFQSLVKEVMPAVTIFGKYVPDSEGIIERAHDLEEATQPDPSLTSTDIHAPGSAKGFQVFPHQMRGLRSLLKHPRFAVLDVAPGGGKTLLLLLDAMNVVNDGLIKTPPCVLAPNNLVQVWCEDLHKVSEGRWNVIPITSNSFRTWGDERLTKMIKSAPPNTIVVLSTSVIKKGKYPLVIGNHVEMVSPVLEFARKFGFEYIALDESHKLKTSSTAVHKAARQLMVSSTVKFVRIASGTLINDKLTDIVGQASLFNPQIFRTADEYEKENSEKLGNFNAVVWREGVPKLARERFGKYTAMISAKKKDWAFMLPRPIETFIPVRLEKEEVEGGAAHQLMYEAILKQTLDAIRLNHDLMKLLEHHTDDDEEEEKDNDEDKDDKDDKEDKDDDFDPTLSKLEQQLQPYLARVEQAITDPMGDPFGEIYFPGIDQENFVSNKVKKIIERIKLNFDQFPWKKGQSYKLKDVVDYDQQRYTLMGPVGKKLVLEDYNEAYTSAIEPGKDPRWKLEPMGKVIVFCRYKRSVEAIYRALPADLQKISVRFHGGISHRLEDFERFRRTPFSTTQGVQVIIANEQSISEGHNLQVASRIVRCESPWSPGTLDQSSSRIFRPDPSGKFTRETIYLDWIVANNTVDVAKLGRLISKMIVKTQFDEAGNPLYDAVSGIQLAPISMGIESIGGGNPKSDKPVVQVLSDISDYVTVYGTLAHIQAAEFEEMRQTGDAKMLDVTETPMMKGAAIIENTPYVPNMKIADRHSMGLVLLSDYLDQTDDPEVEKLLSDPDSLVGSYVHTEFGNGIITKVGKTKVPRDFAGTQEEKLALRKVRKVYVRLANGDSIDPPAPVSQVFLARNVNQNNVGDFGPKISLVSKRDAAAAARVLAAEQKQKDRLEAKAERERQALVDAQNAVSGKKPRPPKPLVKPVEDNFNVTLTPTVFNGMLAIQAVTEDPNLDLTQDGFKRFGNYAYATVKDYKSFTLLLQWLSDNFYVEPNTEKRLNRLHDNFQTGAGRKFAVELSKPASMKNFYTVRSHVESKPVLVGRKKLYEIRIYPVIWESMLMLNIDLYSNPHFRKFLNQTVPGTRIKFVEAAGLWVHFYNNRSEAVTDIKELRRSGINVTNMEQFKQDWVELKTIQLNN